MIPKLAFFCVALQLLAALFQWEFWPLSGHSLYSAQLHWDRITFHDFEITYADGHVKKGVFNEMRGTGGELKFWCDTQKAIPGFRKIASKKTYFTSQPGGGVALHRDEPENPCEG